MADPISELKNYIAHFEKFEKVISNFKLLLSGERYSGNWEWFREEILPIKLNFNNDNKISLEICGKHIFCKFDCFSNKYGMLVFGYEEKTICGENVDRYTGYVLFDTDANLYDKEEKSLVNEKGKQEKLRLYDPDCMDQVIFPGLIEALETLIRVPLEKCK
jgi:hypothetical protein